MTGPTATVSDWQGFIDAYQAGHRYIAITQTLEAPADSWGIAIDGVTIEWKDGAAMTTSDSARPLTAAEREAFIMDRARRDLRETLAADERGGGDETYYDERTARTILAAAQPEPKPEDHDMPWPAVDGGDV